MKLNSPSVCPSICTCMHASIHSTGICQLLCQTLGVDVMVRRQAWAFPKECTFWHDLPNCRMGVSAMRERRMLTQPQQGGCSWRTGSGEAELWELRKSWVGWGNSMHKGPEEDGVWNHLWQWFHTSFSWQDLLWEFQRSYGPSSGVRAHTEAHAPKDLHLISRGT